MSTSNGLNTTTKKISAAKRKRNAERFCSYKNIDFKNKPDLTREYADKVAVLEEKLKSATEKIDCHESERMQELEFRLIVQEKDDRRHKLELETLQGKVDHCNDNHQQKGSTDSTINSLNKRLAKAHEISEERLRRLNLFQEAQEERVEQVDRKDETIKSLKKELAITKTDLQRAESKIKSLTNNKNDQKLEKNIFEYHALNLYSAIKNASIELNEKMRLAELDIKKGVGYEIEDAKYRTARLDKIHSKHRETRSTAAKGITYENETAKNPQFET